jgi:hypothetical protein
MGTQSRMMRRVLILAAGLSVLLVASSSMADDRKTKGLFLYNLAKYVRWPEGTFATDSSPIVIGVAGDERFADVLEEIVSGHKAQGRDLEVMRLQSEVPARGVHVVYFPGRNYGSLRRQAELFAPHPTIRVAEHKRFARVGDVGIVMLDGRIVFYVNGSNAQREGLQLSSKFMRLASGVE